MATMDPQPKLPGPGARSPVTDDQTPPRRTQTAIAALFSCVVLSLAATLAVIATTSPA